MPSSPDPRKRQLNIRLMPEQIERLREIAHKYNTDLPGLLRLIASGGIDLGLYDKKGG